MPVTVGLGLAAVSALYGGIKASQADKAAKNNLANRPVYAPQPEDDSQLNLAESQAGGGMSAASRQALLNTTQGNTAAALNASMRSGGNPNAMSSIVDKSQQQLNNVAIYDDEARQAHIGTLLNTYRQYADQRQANADKRFQINQYAPWADRQQLYSQEKQAGQNMMNTGFSSLGKGLMSFGGGGSDTPDTTMRDSRGDQMAPLQTSGPSSFPAEAPAIGMAPYYNP